MITFKIHPLTYFILLSICLTGYYNYFLIISFILIIHDLGHLLLFKLFKIKVRSILILPFGSLINSDLKLNTPSFILFLISIAGIIMQLLLYPLVNLLFNIGLINHLSYQIFMFYNKLIICFNLLPINPLDGSKLLNSILELYIPYKLSLIIINLLSLILIILFILTNQISLNLILITSFLFYKTYTYLLNLNFIYNSFLLERYLNHSIYSKIKKIKNLNYLYKNRFNFINGISEDKCLKQWFSVDKNP